MREKERGGEKRKRKSETGQDNGAGRGGAPRKVSSTAVSDTSRLTAILRSGSTIYP